MNDGFPDELLEQLSKSFIAGRKSLDFDEVVAHIKGAVESHDRPVTVDEIIVFAYKQHQTILKRASLLNKLGLLTAKDVVVKPTKRTYSYNTGLDQNGISSS